MTWHNIDTWIVIVGILTAVSCAIPGSFLVLRKMSMMGDAISHAVLPGLAIAFLFTHSRASPALFIGAAVVGILTAVLTQWISRFGHVDRSAAMGVVFTTFFALGLLLIVQSADHVDLDPSCVLYGAIELTPLQVAWRPVLFGLELEVPEAVLVLGGVLLVNILFVLFFFKELQVSSFDPELATTLGINADLVHYSLIVLVAVTVIAAFEAVGSIIVIAMLIVPAAAAHLLTDKLGTMILTSSCLAAFSAVLGHLGALVVPGWLGFESTSTAGMMAVAAGLVFTLIFLFAPHYGVIASKFRRAATIN